MQVGDIITLTKEDFLRLAPLGLQVKVADSNLIYYYSRIAAASYLARYNEIPGYGYHYHIDSNNIVDHIRGLWDKFDGTTPFIVVATPNLKIYKRHT